MTWSRAALFVVVAGVVACATPPPPPPVVMAAPPPPPKAKALDPITVAPQMVPTRMSPEAVRERVRQRLENKGFPYAAPIRPEAAPSGGGAPIARATRVLDRTPLSEPNCGGSVEIIQAAFEQLPNGSRMSLWCYSSVLDGFDETGDRCRQKFQGGCPDGGDRMLGEIALDAVGVAGF